MELRAYALAALAEADVERKVALALDTASKTAIDFEAILTPPAAAPLPGRPARPRLIEPARLPHRSPHSMAGRAALVHAICHIEFNAINLALDAIWRFAALPEAYYRDWARVAAEEAQHFQLLHAHLQTLGHRYGDFDAHDGLWAMCEKTRDDLAARMALVPRTLEARGLDATPQIQAKLRAVGSADALAACAILDVILRDEVGHVAIGNHWYRWACARQGVEPLAHEALLRTRYAAPRPRPPLNEAARRAAGFTEAELAALRAP